MSDQEDNKEQPVKADSGSAKELHINLKVNYEGNEVFFKIKRTTQLSKLMDAFCKRQGLSTDQLRFVFDGNRLTGNETAERLDMDDQDTIDVLVQQTGGSAVRT